MLVHIEISDEQRKALFEEGTKGWSKAEIKRVRYHGTREREVIRAAILRRLPS